MRNEVELRAAVAADLEYLSELARDPLVEPYLAPGVADLERLEAIVSRAESEGPPSGLFVIQTGSGQRLGGLALVTYSQRSRICDLTTLMVSPQARRTGVASAAVRLVCHYALIEHGFHRLQAETYADNLAGQRLFERIGFVREAVRRQAYWRRGQWLDGVMYGILTEELG